MNDTDGEPDQFWLQKVYPEAAEAFCFSQETVGAIKDDCIVILDANVLLLPYRLGSRSFEEIQKVYRKLSDDERIYIPTQAAREFIKHRGEKLRDIVRTLTQQASSINNPSDKMVAFLKDNKTYEQYCELSKQIENLRKEAVKKVREIASGLRTEIGKDPVSTVYAEIFGGRIFDPCFEDLNAVLDEMKWRYDHEIPPGYKDRDKFDDGIGDLIIWKTVLKIGKDMGKSCVFVTEDAKGDWWVQSEGTFQPRVELIEEFRRETGGLTVHLMPLSDLLELYGASESAVSDTKATEAARRAREQARESAVKLENAVSMLGDDRYRYLLKANLSTLSREEMIRLISDLGEARKEVVMRRGRLSRLLESEDLIDVSDAEVPELFAERRELSELSIALLKRRNEVSNYVENLYRQSVE